MSTVPINLAGNTMFQSPIGRLQTGNDRVVHGTRNRFQSLIGRLQTIAADHRQAQW